MSEAENGGMDPESVWSSRRALLVIALCLIVLGLVGMGVTAVFVINQRDFVINQREYNTCQRAHNDEVIAALRERSKAGDLDRVAIRGIAESGVQMLKIILEPGATQQQKLEAVQKWQVAQTTASQQLSDADDKRSQAPLPPPRQC